MKRRVAKKIVNLYARNLTKGLNEPKYLRRDLVVRAHKYLGRELPVFDSEPQEPGEFAVQPKVSNTGTSDGKALKVQEATAANVLTNLSTENLSTENLTVAQLKTLCKERGIKGYSKLKRDGLVAVLRDA